MNDFINNVLKSKKLAGLYLNDSYGTGIKKIIDSNTSVDNVDNEMFESASTDFRTQLLKIKESGADTLVIVAHDEYPTILKQLNELKLDVKIITSETFKDEKIVLNYTKYEYPEYNQLHKPFYHFVTILDLIFNCGDNSPYYIWGWRKDL